MDLDHFDMLSSLVLYVKKVISFIIVHSEFCGVSHPKFVLLLIFHRFCDVGEFSGSVC